MLKKWTPSDAFLPSLIPGSPCPGPPLPSWGWTTRKAIWSLGLEALLLCCPSAQLSKMPLVNLSMIFRPLITNLPEGKYIKPPPSTAKWYKVGQPCYEDKIQELILQKSVLLLNPLGPYGQGSPTNSQGIGTSS